MKKRFASDLTILSGLAMGSLLAPTKAWALPQFARLYNLKCTACHTIVPVLNKQGYLFQRLGYHLPPALEAGEAAPLLSEIGKNVPEWTLGNSVSVAVTDFGYSAERVTEEGQSPISTAGFQVDSWNAYFAGLLPGTNFFYHAELDIVVAGVTNPDLSNACVGYTWGTAKSSWYAVGGREHLQVAQGTRAAEVYSLLPNAPLLFENLSPTNFIFDQSPVGVNAGYTWASTGYRRIFAASAKVVNGDNADGSEILSPSRKHSPDAWADVDFWYAPESGVTVLGYYGRKDQIQNTDPAGQFTFRPIIRREGVFGNYMLKYKVDFLGGYLHSHDGWQALGAGPLGRYTSDGYYGAVDYYIIQGLAVSARYDLLRQQVTDGVGLQSVHDWAAGINKTLTPSGNVIVRASYSDTSGRDPVFAVKTKDKLFRADILFNW